MRIDRLAMKDFRSHAEFAMEFDRFNFIIGPNAAGKSSIGMAIEFLLTGKCDVTDAAGRGAEELIRLGAKGFMIAAELRSGMPRAWTVIRRKTARTHELELQAAGTLPLPEAQAKLLARLGTSCDVLSAVLNSSRFVEMSEAEQKNLLSQALASAAPEVPAEIYADARALLGDPPFQKVSSIGDIDKLHKLFYEMRTDANRRLKSLGTMDEPKRPQDMPNSEATKAALDKLRRQLTEAETRRVERVSAYELLGTRRKDLTEEIARAETAMKTRADNWAEEHDAKVQRLKIEISAAQKAVLSAEDERRLMEIEGRAPQVKQLQKKLAMLEAQIAEKQQAIDAIIELKAAECPTCHRSLSVKTKGEIQEALGRMQDMLIAERDDVRKKIEKAGDPEAATSRLRPHREATVARERLKRELDEAEREKGPDLADIEHQASAAKAKLDALPKMDAPNVADLDAEIEALRERIAKGEEVLEKVRGIERQRDEWGKHKVCVENVSKEIERLERLVTFFGPNGVRAKMAGDKLGPFTEAMNESLKVFDYYVQLDMEPYGFTVTSAERGGGYASTRSLSMLSESERFRFSVAFQIALAKATGLNFVVIDRADVLDDLGRTQMTRMLEASGLEQAIVLATSSQNPPPAHIFPEGVKFIRIGQAEAVAA